jgi:hypothetical protein
MKTFKVRALPNGDYQDVRGSDEVDAAERLLQIPLQLQPRSNIDARALVRGPAHRGNSILLYAKDEGART